MLEGMYAAASGMEAQQTQLDAISNDIANADTPGYQASEVGFHDLLYSSDGYGQINTGAGAAASVIGYDETQGSLQQTGNPLDVAIEGPGYLEVRQADGTIGLTRNGTLAVNASGELETSTGLPLEPPITLPAGADPSRVSIGSDGTVSLGGQTLGRLSLVDVPNPGGLLSSGSSVLTPTAASGGLVAASGATLQQGALEGSNVDLNAEMTDMITAEQSYDMASKAISFESQMGQIAATLKSGS